MDCYHHLKCVDTNFNGVVIDLNKSTFGNASDVIGKTEVSSLVRQVSIALSTSPKLPAKGKAGECDTSRIICEGLAFRPGYTELKESIPG